VNEFIVWDGIKFFSFDEVLRKFNITILEADDMDEEYSIHPYIGKTDDTLEKNKIYADCSIVEFIIKGTREKGIGYFTYNKEKLRYEVMYLDEESLEFNKSFEFSRILNLKVIGTLQENKELLK